MTDFKVGDRVRIRPTTDNQGFWSGQEGVVRSATFAPARYGVLLDDGGGFLTLWDRYELEAVTSGSMLTEVEYQRFGDAWERGFLEEYDSYDFEDYPDAEFDPLTEYTDWQERLAYERGRYAADSWIQRGVGMTNPYPEVEHPMRSNPNP